MNGMRIVVLIAALGGLMSAAVDPDELLKALRRISYRSALTATLATRLVPVLARDAARMGDAARCRPQPPGRLAVVRAALAGALDRAVDVAAALEVRGYSLAGRPARAAAPCRATTCASARRRFAVAAAAIAGAVAGRRRRGVLPDPGAGARPGRGRARGRAGGARGAPRWSAARPAWGWRVPEPLVRAERFALLATRRRAGRLPARHLARARARHLHRAGRRVRARASPRCCARCAGWCRTSTAARRAGELVVGGLDVREHGPGELAAVCGTVFQEPETQVVMGGVRAELELPLEHRGEPAAAVARAVEETALSLGVGAPARAPHRHALGRRAAARGDRRGDGPRPRAAAARRAHLAARPGRGRRAGLAPAAAERGLGHGRGGGRAPARALPARGRSRDRAGRGPRSRATPRRASTSPGRWRRCRCWPRRPPACSRSPGCRSAPASVKEARAALREARVDLEPPAAARRDQPAAAAPAARATTARRPRWRCAASGSRSRTARACCAAWTCELRPGERVALMGRNGAGKSTLLRLAKGLAEPTRGRVERAGEVALLLQNPGDYLIHDHAVEDAGAGGRGGRGPRGPRRREPARPVRRRAPAARAGGGARRRERGRRAARRAHARDGPRAQGRAGGARRRAGGRRGRGRRRDPRHRVRRLVRATGSCCSARAR